MPPSRFLPLLSPTPPPPLLQPQSQLLIPKLPLTSHRIPHFTLACTPSPNNNSSSSSTSPLPHHRQPSELLLQYVAEDSDEKTRACVRTFENDSAWLSLVGSVDFDQALTAAAADGGRVADEHVASGLNAMVVETVFPGFGDYHATVSTRLFLVAKKVKEKAKKLKRAFQGDIFSSVTSKNILAMTFRQVVLQRLWNLELAVFRPGAERNMKDLENPREVSASFFLRSSDDRILSMLAEAVCKAALDDTERHFVEDGLGKGSISFLHLFQKRRKIASTDSSVVIYKFLEDEIVESAKNLLEEVSSANKSLVGMKMRDKYGWWMPLAHSKLKKVGGPGLSAWMSEYVPAYLLQIDANKVEGVKLEGWTNSSDNLWEVLLTHSQMVGLAEVLDMYYEDVYSLPYKELSCSFDGKLSDLSIKKKGSSLLNMFSIAFASGIFVIAIGALRIFVFPHFRKGQPHPQESTSLSLSEIKESSHVAKIRDTCSSIMKRVKATFDLPGDVNTRKNIGVSNYINTIPPSGEKV